MIPCRSILTKKFIGVPTTTAIVLISMDIIFFHREGPQTVEIFVGDSLTWSGTQTSGEATPGTCVEVSPRMSATGVARVVDGAFEIVVWGSTVVGGPAFAIDNIKAVRTQPGSLPWSPGESDFTQWADGWMGINSPQQPARTTCGEYGTILGGFPILGRNAILRKTYQGLGSHNALRISLKFFKIHTWDSESALIRVDGRVRAFAFSITCGCYSPFATLLPLLPPLFPDIPSQIGRFSKN